MIHLKQIYRYTLSNGQLVYSVWSIGVISQIACRCRTDGGPLFITPSTHWRHQPVGRRNFVLRSNVGSTETNQSIGPPLYQNRQTNQSNVGSTSTNQPVGPTATNMSRQANGGTPNIYMHILTNYYKQHIKF